MKIASSNISLTSQHSYSKKHIINESLNSWVGVRRPAFNIQRPLLVTGDSVHLSQESKEFLQKLRELKQTKSTELENPIELSEPEKQKIAVLEELLSALTGKTIKIQVPKIKLEKLSPENLDNLQKVFHQQPAISLKQQGWGVEYNYQESYLEEEKLSFQAEGCFQTSDGQKIKFQLDLNMSRQFYQQTNIQVKAGDALIDPLVINYDAPAAQLTNRKFSFDLDADGKEEDISFLQPGSGFLALDKNEDGTINDGRELFGPGSGHGFAELAQYDEDQNGWIDENDSIFQKLRIWTKDQEGKDQLFALGQKSIGALYLGNIGAQFQMKNTNNQELGQGREAGIFLRENGTAGVMQEIDLVV